MRSSSIRLAASALESGTGMGGCNMGRASSPIWVKSAILPTLDSTPCPMHDLKDKAVLVTGAARRVGAAIARRFHSQGANVLLHYRGGEKDAIALEHELNAARKGSVRRVKADLLAHS